MVTVIFIVSGADINNGPLPAQSTFIAQIFIELFGNSGPKTKQKNKHPAPKT